MALADLNVLGAFNQARDLSMREGTNNLQKVGILQGILAKQQAAQKEQAFRSALAAAKTPEEQALVAVRFGSPESIMTNATRQTQIKATQEAAKARLLETARMNDSLINHRIAQETNADRKLQLEQQRDQMRNHYNQKNLELGGERLFYDTGTRINTQAPVPAVAGALGGGEATFNFRLPNGQAISGTAPNEAGAIGIGQNALGMRPGVLSQVAAQVPQSVPTAPAEAPVAAPAAFPAAPNNLDARDLGAGARGPVMGSTPAPVAAPVAPVMPQFSGSPREKAAAENRWRLQQSKPSIAGASPITPETADRLAEQALNGDERALTPFVRNQSAMAIINNAITKKANDLGMTGGDIVGRKADLVANRTALTAVTKDLAAITPFKEMLDQNAQIAINLGRKIAADKTSSAFINRPLIWVKNNLSDRPDVAEYLAQMHFVEVEAARVLTQPRLVGQLTDQAISDMKSILSGNMTIASTEAVINRIRADGDNRIRSMKTQQQRIRAQLTGGTPKTRDSDKPKADQFFR